MQLRLVGAVPRGRAARPAAAAREVITSPLTFSTDLAPLVRAGSRAGVRRRRARHLQRRRRRDRGDDRPDDPRDPHPEPRRQRPDWDGIRAIADRHGLAVIEDSCDALGPDAARHADRHALRHLGHELRAVAHHHLRRQRRHGAARRRELPRPLPLAAPLGPAVGAAALRLAARANATSGRTSTASATTTCSSSTSSGGTSSRPSWAPPSACSSSRSCRTTTSAGSATSPLHRVLRPLSRATSSRRARPPSSRPRGSRTVSMIHPDAGFARSDLQAVLEARRHRHPHGLDRERDPSAHEGRSVPRTRGGLPTPTGDGVRDARAV